MKTDLLASLPKEFSWREKLAYLTYRFHQMDQVETPVSHKWEDGKYIREMDIPEDTLFIGRTHLHGHYCELMEGSVIHIMEKEKAVRDAPFSVTTKPGYQMVFYTLTPIKGRTVHPDTGERDIEKAEAQIFEPLRELLTLGEKLAVQVYSERLK